MKKLMTLSFALLTINVSANGLDVAHRYQNALDAHKIDKNTNKAKTILEDVLAEMSNDHSLFVEVYNTYLDYSGVKASEDLEKAVKFATGVKEEVFCKGVGLVNSKLLHNDGTISKLFLGNGNRSFVDKESYSVMSDGRWNYHLDTAYRTPVMSEVWINSADANHFSIQELRETAGGKDKGKWTAKWNGGSFSNNYDSTGNVKEPIPMYMAMDYQKWGTPGMGYRINFKVGETDKVHSHESTFGHGKIQLTALRLVKKKMNNFEASFSGQKNRKYKDCYFVETKIQFAGLDKNK